MKGRKEGGKEEEREREETLQLGTSGMLICRFLRDISSKLLNLLTHSAYFL